MQDQVWAWLAPALEAGVDTDTREDLETQLASGRAQLWVGDAGALVTQLVRRREVALVHCWLGGGRLRSLLDMRGGVEAWGRAHGCRFATIQGRRGWDRLFARHGYRRVGEDLVKTL